MQSDVTVQGIGWVTNAEYGSVRRGTRVSFAGRTDVRRLHREKELFAYPVKNFARFDAPTRLTCCAVALSLRDADVSYGEKEGLDFALVGSGPGGCLQANFDYFRDYAESGRTMGRGNLFIYTLPTSPLAEAAIHFGFAGPLLFIGASQAPMAAAVRTATDMVERRAVVSAAATYADADGSICLLLARPEPPTAGCLCDVDEITARIGQCDGLSAMVEAAAAETERSRS